MQNLLIKNIIYSFFLTVLPGKFLKYQFLRRTILPIPTLIKKLHYNDSENKLLTITANAKDTNNSQNVLYALLSVGTVAAGLYLSTKKVLAEQVKNDKEDYRQWHKTAHKNLPTYKIDEVRKHDSLDKRVWVTYGIGVYDITEFIPKHPGSDKIMMAAGTAIDSFWSLYQQHNTEEILTLLEKYRIGNIAANDLDICDNMESPWAGEPKRNELLKVTSEQPFNAEPPLAQLGESFYTSNDIFYIRNHLPVPKIDETEFVLNIELETQKASGKLDCKSLTLEDIKKLPRNTVVAAIMCGGNRRSEMAVVKPIKGLSWDAGAVGNAKWTGVRLRDLLLAMGVESNEKLHVIFEGADLDATSNPYGASIPLTQAMDSRADVLLAYEMNGEPLSRDHGFPLRAIIPGTVGARNVKWLSRIAVSEEESFSHWQRNDYKGFSPSTDWDTVDFTKSPSIQAMPVTSAICTPSNGDTVKVESKGFLTVHGYAWSGGGRRIVRVDVTTDKGKSWHVAELEQEDLPDGRHFGWSLWTAKIPANKLMEDNIEIWAKAVDSAYNVQPESFENIWNLRGVLANAYHRISVKLSYLDK